MFGLHRFPNLGAVAARASFGVLFASSLLWTSCNDPDPAEAMLKQMSAAPPPPPAAAPATPPVAAPGAGGQSASADPTAPLSDPTVPPADGTAPAAGEVPAGPKVELEVKSVKSPYPEFVGRGNYSVTLAVTGMEPTDFAVWEFVAYDIDGKEVGRFPQALKVPYKNSKDLEFTSMYFLGKPDRFEMVLTDKKAVKAEGGGTELANNNGGGGGNQGGGSGGPTMPGNDDGSGGGAGGDGGAGDGEEL